ncbi:MAG: sigma-70 family RNA polymerase sigma factor [Planctomycetes bacterium]|nr:sigma-70 family RNA polymerase sigma factor [Planctomycetota bacterium]MCL4731447.1 sigma-70 family RNA polymerase sigma factor [Planctomycetota bacterium]
MAEAPDDAALIARSLRGDDGAFAALVERHWATAYGSAWAVLNNAGDAEEMAQETFVQVYQKLAALRDPGALGGWVWRIARDTSLKHIRKHKRVRPAAEVPDVPQTGSPPELPMVQGEERRALMDALAELPDDMREALVMRYWQDLEYEQMAEQTGASEAALYQRVCRGLKRLRELLEAKEKLA